VCQVRMASVIMGMALYTVSEQHPVVIPQIQTRVIYFHFNFRFKINPHAPQKWAFKEIRNNPYAKECFCAFIEFQNTPTSRMQGLV